MHDVKGPLLALWAHGWELAGVASDTALAAYLALPGQRSFDLADLALRYLRRELQGRRRARGPADPRRARARARPTSPREAAHADVLGRRGHDLADALETDLGQRGGDRAARRASSCR